MNFSEKAKLTLKRQIVDNFEIAKEKQGNGIWFACYKEYLYNHFNTSLAFLNFSKYSFRV